MSYLKLITVGLVAVLLAGCPASPSVPDPEPTDTTYGESGASTDGMGDGGMGDGEYLDDPSAGELQMVIYFDFDSSEVRPQDRDLVSRHAVLMSNNTRVNVRLEGHADERGSREYNIGLGERRSVSVKSILLVHGAAESQLVPVSFGEERPADLGGDETAWQLNRRVELVYER